MTENVTVTVTGDREVVLSFQAASVAVAEQAARVTRHYGQLLTTQVQAKASGRPGPNAPTGDYRRSIHLQVYAEGFGKVTAAVGTNKPQGARLEFGFAGVDSLGRVYDQPPYPHFGPAFDLIAPRYESAMERVVRQI